MGFNPLYCVYCGFTIKQRLVMAVMVHLCLLNAYHLRVVLSIALTEILEPKRHEEGDFNACPMYNYTEVSNIEGGKYKWPNIVEARILYAFYFGYIFSQIPGGRLADIIGSRHVLGTCMLVSVLITFFYPLAIIYWGHWGAIGLRVILGFAQGPIYPAVASMIQTWVPKEERGWLGGIALSGANLGTISGNILTGEIILWQQSWAAPFYMWGLVALLWYIFAMMMMFSAPTTHPFITGEEKEELEKRLDESKKLKVPWAAMFRSRVVHALILGQFAHNYMYLTLVTDLPKYFNNILKLDVRMNAVYTSIPFLFIWIVSIISAYTADWVVRRELMTVLNVRRVWTFIASVVSGAFLVFTAYVGCSREWGLVLYTIAIGLHGTIYAGLRINVNDITRHHGGTITAIKNSIGSMAGVIGPYLVGVLTPNHSLEEWQIFFWIMFVIQVVTTAYYWVFTSVERQDWDYEENERLVSE